MEKSDWRKLFERGKKRLENNPVSSPFHEEGVYQEDGIVVEGGNEWHIYDNSAFGQEGYFDRRLDSFVHIVSFEKAKANLKELQKQHEGMKVVILDIMGQGGIGNDLGADIAIGWTYKDHKELEREPNRIIAEGDLFDRTVQKEHINNLKRLLEEQNAFLGAVFFRSVGGYGLEKENLYANALLYERYFRKLYRLAPIGAHFYLNINMGNSYGAQLERYLKENGYELLTNHDRTLFCSVLVKTEGKPELPSLEALFPDIRLLKMER